ncbi:hypothetical protein M3Y99_01930500 [Aphelenchoides fujianensis]|nr:hypothetical protein M3Y99_01930500 [Aphelenchoides fujianensis]
MAPVIPKLRMRTVVRNGVNRFSLLAAMVADERKAGTHIIRLAAISRTHLAAFRDAVRGIKLAGIEYGGFLLHLDLGPASPMVEFAVKERDVVEDMVKLLRVPVHLDPCWMEDVDWEEWLEIAELVTGLTADECECPVFTAFVDRVIPHLKELKCHESYLKRFPPLSLDKLVICDLRVDYEALRRHKIRRLDVRSWEVEREFPPDHVLSTSIKALGISDPSAQLFSSGSIETFCRRFPALEELHFTGTFSGTEEKLDEHFKQTWSECLKFRDRVDIPSLKRLFFTFNETLIFDNRDPEPDWMQKLKQTAPFNQAVFWVDPVNDHERMFLNHSCLEGPKPSFFHIEADFCWTYEPCSG